jgi:hypothetical protein
MPGELRKTNCLLGMGLVLTVLGLGGVSRAAAAASSEAIKYGGEAYQRRLIQETLAQNHLEPDPHPEGKAIERIVVVPYGVVLPDEPYPKFLNWFHMTTRPDVVERELLFHAGDRWSEERVEESSRNLRNYLFVTMAQVVPCKGSDPGHVVALVVTKDLWSLRPNTNFSFVGSKLEFLQAELTEQNVAGRMKKATLDFGFDLAAYYAGQQYQDPRLLGSELTFTEHGDLIWNRDTGHLEGGVASLSIQQPLYTLDTPWGWMGSAQFRQDIYRLFQNGQLASFVSPTTGQSYPYSFERHTVDLQFGVTRSIGHASKHDISAGYRAFVHDFAAPAAPYAVQSVTVADFNSMVLPRTESAGMLFVSYHAYQANYRELLDIQSYAVTEDYRLGLDFTAEARVANPAFGFSSSFLEPIANAAWTNYSHDDLFTASASFDSRFQPELDSSNAWVDGILSAGVRNVSPRWSFMRLHTALRMGHRFNDFNHNFTTLGGDTSLRGYPSNYFRGANFWVGNAEARTQPVNVYTVHVGLATFVDVGGAANVWTTMGAHASVGAGLRVGFPQFDRDLFRVDFATPLETVQDATPAYIVAQYGQAF